MSTAPTPNLSERRSSSPTLSVVIPAYNEIVTIGEVLSRVRAVSIDKEIIIVDDGSTDGTREYLSKLPEHPPSTTGSHASGATGSPGASNEVRVVLQERNRGKGAALRRGFECARGQIVVIQDADLELNPNEYPKLIEPILKGQADVVYGSRFLANGRNGVPISRYLANRILTITSNLCTHLKLTDVWTGYKTFRRDVLDQIELREDRFGFEPEITAKIARRSYRIVEVPVTYECRSYSEGKKISWKDSFRGIWCTLRYSLLP
jgi:glycosyltransferase involved in cell wall biosynthesis